MATTFKEGDRVQVVDRDATADDVKSGLFYNYFRGLTGTIQKVYASEEAAVEVEQESLAEPVAQRHLDVQEQMKAKWLDGLSEEARNRLSDQEKDFRLRYTILIALKDLAAPGARVAAAKRSPTLPEAPPAAVRSESAPPRATSHDYDAAEEAELARRRDGGN